MYDFKKMPEALWFIGVAVIVFVAEAVKVADFAEVATDPEAYLVAVVGGAARAGIVAALAFFPR
jgi:hypothetical protein